MAKVYHSILLGWRHLELKPEVAPILLFSRVGSTWTDRFLLRFRVFPTRGFIQVGTQGTPPFASEFCQKFTIQLGSSLTALGAYPLEEVRTLVLKRCTPAPAACLLYANTLWGLDYLSPAIIRFLSSHLFVLLSFYTLGDE